MLNTENYSLPPRQPLHFLPRSFVDSCCPSTFTTAKALKLLHSELGLDDKTTIFVPSTWIRNMNDIVDFSTAFSTKITLNKDYEERSHFPQTRPKEKNSNHLYSRRSRKASISSIINATTLAPSTVASSARRPFCPQLNHMNLHPMSQSKLTKKSAKPPLSAGTYSTSSRRHSRNIHRLEVNVTSVATDTQPLATSVAPNSNYASSGRSGCGFSASYAYPLSPCSSADTYSSTIASSAPPPFSPVREFGSTSTISTSKMAPDVHPVVANAMSQQEHDALQSLLSL